MEKKRTEVERKDCWNVEAMYEELSSWQRAYDEARRRSENNSWPKIQQYRGHLGEPAKVLALLEEYFNTVRELEKLYVYAHLRHDEETTLVENKEAYQRISNDLHDFRTATAWIEPELLALSEEECDRLLACDELFDYRFHLEKIIRLRPHTLSPDKEELMAMCGKALQGAPKAFRALNDADFKFGEVEDSQGEKKSLTHASYFLFLRSRDRNLRAHAFEAMHRRYFEYENTLTELLQATVQSHLLEARARGYSSCLEASLFPKNLDTGLYHNLIETVHNNLDALHRYTAVRKKIMGIDELHPYDLYVPLVEEVDIKIEYDAAGDKVVDSSKILGEEYYTGIKEGLKGSQRWVDRYENANKRSGAYSSGCYDSYPYILMNFKGVLRDAFTLAHEAGHSMHSLLSHTHQPYHYGDYPIFLAEVASTFNEQLLMDRLLLEYQDDKSRAFLLNEKIEEIRSTLFRQVLFAEFELFVHECAEENRPLTPKLLKDKYRSLVQQYYGPELCVDELLDSEWSRIPHFYYNFYVYQYATGISAALALYNRAKEGGEKERDEYLGFLKAGSSQYPLDILDSAGVDMRTGDAVKAAINTFRDAVDELEALLVGAQA